MGRNARKIHIFDRSGGDQTWTGESACGEVRIAHRDALATPTADGTSAEPRAVDVVLPHDAERLRHLHHDSRSGDPSLPGPDSRGRAMTADRIDMRDAYWDTFSMVTGAALTAIESHAGKLGAVVGIEKKATDLVALTENGAVEVASFLGRSVSPAACRDLLAELAQLACSDDLPKAVKAFLVGEAPPFLKRITAEGLARGTVVRSLIELGRALGRAESKGEASGVEIGEAARGMVAEQEAMATRNDHVYAEWVRVLRGMPALQHALAELAKLTGGES